MSCNINLLILSVMVSLLYRLILSYALYPSIVVAPLVKIFFIKNTFYKHNIKVRSLPALVPFCFHKLRYIFNVISGISCFNWNTLCTAFASVAFTYNFLPPRRHRPLLSAIVHVLISMPSLTAHARPTVQTYHLQKSHWDFACR